jgi:hypothetical protein
MKESLETFLVHFCVTVHQILQSNEIRHSVSLILCCVTIILLGIKLRLILSYKVKITDFVGHEAVQYARIFLIFQKTVRGDCRIL